MMNWDIALPGAQLIFLLLIWRTLRTMPSANMQSTTKAVTIAGRDREPETTVHFEMDSLLLAALYRYCTCDGMNEVFAYVGGIRVGRSRFVLSHLVPVALAQQSAGGATADETSSIQVLEELDRWGTPMCGHVHSHPGHGPHNTRPSDTDRQFIDQLAAGGHRVLGMIVSRGYGGHDAYVRFYMHDSASFVVLVSGHNVEPVEGERNVYRISNLDDRGLPIPVPEAPLCSSRRGGHASGPRAGI